MDLTEEQWDAIKRYFPARELKPPGRRGGVEDVEGFIDGTYVPAKKGGPALGGAVPARRQRSWQLQTAMVFHSLSLLKGETDSTVFSPSELSTLLSWSTCRLD